MTIKYGTNNSEYLEGTDYDDKVYAGAGDDSVDGWNGRDTLYGEAGNDSLYGGRNDDTLVGGSGNDHLYGQDDNDILNGGAGNDELDGGYGQDTADYSDAHHSVLASIDKGYARGIDVGSDTLWSIENITGGDGNDILHGDNGGFLGIGGNGANVLDGQGGDDFLNGWGGDDTLLGGDGQDTLYGGDGDDRLYGQMGNDWLSGEAGNDYLNGGAGNDTLEGGAGNDTLDGGDGVDTAYYGHATGGVIVRATFTDGSAEGTDTFVNVENIQGSAFDDILAVNALGQDPYAAHVVDGGDGNDTIWSEAGDDMLRGGSGNDYIDGSDGANILVGGAGSDTFAFIDGSRWWSMSHEYDNGVITDFQEGVDHIMMQTDAVEPLAGYQSGLHFIDQKEFAGLGELREAYRDGNTYLEGNVDFDMQADWVIELAGNHHLSSSDFSFI